MSKTKNIIEKATDQSLQAAGQLGIYMMAIATLSGLVVPGHEDKRVILPGQANFAFAEETNNPENNPIRREKESEESGPHYVSYGVTQRTPARSGKF